jgi:cyanophycinase
VWSGAAAAAACDPMVDDRGGALTVGLGVVDDIIVIPAWETWSGEARRRLRRLLPAGRLVVGIPSGSAVIPRTAGWATVGEGIEAERDGEPVALSPRS